MNGIRKVYKYVKTECEMRELKRGDLFSMEPTDESDKNCNPRMLYLATADATPLILQNDDRCLAVGRPTEAQVQGVGLRRFAPKNPPDPLDNAEALL